MAATVCLACALGATAKIVVAATPLPKRSRRVDGDV
jgi:hypothetical protein